MTSPLTAIQREALLTLYHSDVPVRGGYNAGRPGKFPGPRINSGTGGSLVNRGLANQDPGPKGDRRGMYFSLTLAGRLVASGLARKEQA
jgi:hypothetical protein